MNEFLIKNILSTLILIGLLVLSFMIIKPIILSVIMGLLLAFFFSPLYRKVYFKTNSRNISAWLVTIFLLLLMLLPTWFLASTAINQSVRIYLAIQQVDFVEPLKSIFPSIFSSETFSTEVGTIINSFLSKATNSIMNSLSKIILNFPTIFLQSIVVLFTFFFGLRDGEQLVAYIKSLLPFSKEIEEKLFKSSRDITYAVVYGQVLIGLLQGLIAGLGFFIFSVSNSLFLTLLACLAGIFPIIGTTIIWAPVAIYLFVADSTFAAIGVAIFGMISISIDNFIRPFFVSKRTQLKSSLVLIGMIGGLFLFGILGFILGPLILAYLLIILELYRKKSSPALFIQKS